MPYALESPCEERKARMSTSAPTHNSQFTPGTYTCPLCSLVYVCVRRGSSPNRWACIDTLNAPAITACDAMIVARVARITTGN